MLRWLRDQLFGRAWSVADLALDPDGFDPDQLPPPDELAELDDDTFQLLLDALPPEEDEAEQGGAL
ncbi:MAG: hypothetical protein AAF074_17490 [Pseudomonadota bacterium]